MASEDHVISDEDNQSNKKQKRSERRRGPTTAKYITKDDNGPYPLKWNEYGSAVGEFKDRYTAYTRALACAKVKICISKWSEVDDDVKEKLWSATKNMFKCDDDKKTYVLRDCKSRWKDFKKRLRHDYFTALTKNEEEHPPWVAYAGIDKEDWLKFKEIRKNSKFKELSERNRSNQKKNEHPHHLGHGGYVKREEQYAKEQMKKSTLFGSSGLESNTSSVRMVTPRARYERWIDGRKNKKGEITNPKTKMVVEKINELKEAQKSGEFVPEGSHDILTEALGTPEKGGYVRGLGGNAKLSVVFKRKKRSSQTDGMMTLRQVEEFAIQLTEQVREQTRSEMKEFTLGILKSCGVQIPENLELNLNGNNDIVDGSTPRLTNRSSCQSIDPGPFANVSKEPLPCELNVIDEDVGYRVVAKGTLLWSEPDEIIHNVPLRDDHVKVCFKQVLKGEESTPLPVLFFGHEVLGDDVVGSWAQWPRKRVKVLQEEVNSPQPKKKKKNDDQVATEGMDHGFAAGGRCEENDDDGIPPFLLSKVCLLSLPRSCKELYNLYKGQDIDFNIDVVFEENIFYYQNQQTFIAYVGGYDIKQLLNMEWLNVSCVQIWMRHHWMLVIMCINKGEALLFNSLSGGLDKVHVKGPLSVAYRTLNFSHGARKSLNWTVVDCPQQPGGVECGYYVMMYMHKIVSLISQNESNLQKDFNLAPYSQAKVDEMREIWCRYFIDQCV